MNLSEVSKKIIMSKKYIILEHDHKYVTTNDPSKFVNMIAPSRFIINKIFVPMFSKLYEEYDKKIKG